MEKFLGLEYENLAEREQFIKDNADSIENIGYSKPIPSDQIEKLKETLADASIKKLEQEEAKKAAVQMYNDEIKGYKLTIKDAADKLKSKSTYVNEPCYRIIDEQTRQVGYYNKEGMLVYQRAARHDELQPRLFDLRPGKTGTENK
jgi:hypothetical protein